MQDAMRSEIETHLPELARVEEVILRGRPRPFNSGGLYAPDHVDSGCPIGSMPYDGERVVSEPGRYTVYIYVLPQDEIDILNGSSGLRRVSEEIQCHLDDCGQVATGLKFGPDDLSNPSLVRYLLYEVTGLQCFRPVDVKLNSSDPDVVPECG